MRIQMKSMTLLRVIHGSGNTTWYSQCIAMRCDMGYVLLVTQVFGLGYALTVPCGVIGAMHYMQ